uniref:RNase H type-1 domain-containing protein n=1 Tax=Cajanus cajan TaxID=3821 RepID=A0A151REE3_CAJCA|nr:hypothetical protein KK1_037727 [Cajanus cajan]
MNLQQRGIPCTSLCAHCKSIWMTSSLWPSINAYIDNGEDFKDTIFSLISNLHHDIACKVIVILWSIWRNRNDKVWSGTTTPPGIAVHKANQPPNSKTHVNTWTKPLPGLLKCNVDAAVFKEENIMGFDLCIRNADGSFIKAKSSWQQGFINSQEAKALALLEALTWLSDMGITNAIIETDSKQVVDDVLSSTSIPTEYGHVLRKYQLVLQSHSNLMVRFIRRQTNQVAYTLVRASRFHASSTSFDLIPPCIEILIFNELS